MSRAIVGVDWGTTNLRAFRFDASGAVTETRRSNTGLKSVVDRAFEPALLSVIGEWLTRDALVVISGMAGAREGWIEAPYLACPADAAALAQAMIRAPAEFGEAWMVPGLSVDHADGMTEVMRGEETQIFGALADADPALIIAPGTHSKWALVGGGHVRDSHTYMTGELFALLKAHSILGRLIEGDAHDEAAFELGAERGLANSALLNLLFSARTEGLFKRIAPTSIASYLSGLLIGSEIAEGLSLHKLERSAAILIIGAAEIAALYKAALARTGAENVSVLDGETAAAKGLWQIAQAKARA